VSAILAEEERTAHLVVAWQAALDRLERDVSLAEKLLAHPHADLDDLEVGLDTWQPPLIDGPLPDVLLGRARDLGRRQDAVREGLTRALAGTRAAIERARRTSYAETPTAAPAYLDVSA
jgi:hypothetical protein